ncbi:phosphoribosylglycinamide formyltransferase [Psychroflexus salis]|uniref:Phosphoribosylglycinamide formyltransferase n=1 Tax=Psychroflexus salis TaxID=1526574 RepID=A0A917E5E4_9FLAO|nr:phosphoribosylglycinamide formyltransferase [Psychroflexus salis]GGE02459.1 phosphoribosylglycinamide formyltransferase [Psychroflexus salis]
MNRIKTQKIVIFASGTGTNAENIINYFERVDSSMAVTHVFSNNPKAEVLEKAHLHGVQAVQFDKYSFQESDEVLQLLIDINPELIVLAGFLWKIPKSIIAHFSEKIINIHPALLPNYGGKGMYGDRVHKAVLDNNENNSGITIHYVNEVYDKGKIIFQETVEVEPNDTLRSLRDKIHILEYRHYPKVIQQLLEEN